jgi:hypothetical protein
MKIKSSNIFGVCLFVTLGLAVSRLQIPMLGVAIALFAMCAIAMLVLGWISGSDKSSSHR